MKLEFWSEITLRVVLIFVFFIITSFIPEMDIMHQFFNDRLCSIIGHHKDITYYTTHYHWGYRHWLWLCMGICLAIIQLIRLILYIDKNGK